LDVTSWQISAAVDAAFHNLMPTPAHYRLRLPDAGKTVETDRPYFSRMEYGYKSWKAVLTYRRRAAFCARPGSETEEKHHAEISSGTA
jgi:hypothetical protein